MRVRKGVCRVCVLLAELRVLLGLLSCSPPWRTTFGASYRTTLVTFFDVLPMWPTPQSSVKNLRPMAPMFLRLHPRDSIGGIEPSCSQ